MARVILNYQTALHGFHIRRIPDKSRKGLKLIFPFFLAEKMGCTNLHPATV